jgi:peroxiredoxin
VKNGIRVPTVIFWTRVRDENIEGPNPYRWQPVLTSDFFDNKRVLVFSLPGAFTPTCSTYQVPGFEESYTKIKDLGIDEVYCISVNDSFVMNKWAKDQNISNIKMIPDGNGEFTRQMGMLV